VGALGAAAGLALMLCVPSLEAVSRSILLFAGFHLVGAAVLLVSLYGLGLRKFTRIITIMVTTAIIIASMPTRMRRRTQGRSVNASTVTR
jgi:hypothetical protein